MVNYFYYLIKKKNVNLRWQDNCLEIRDAAQALLIREIDRLGKNGLL